MTESADGAWSKGRPSLIYGSLDGTPEGQAIPVLVDASGRPLTAPQGRVTILAPTYSDATYDDLSLDTAGNLRTRIEAVTGTVPVSDGGGSLTVDGSVSIATPPTNGLSVSTTNATADADGALTVKASAGVLYKVGVVLASSPGSSRWLLIVNKASDPANNDLPLWRIYVPATNGDGLMAGWDFGVHGLPCSTGIALAWSSTADDVTLVTSEAYFQAVYA